MNHITRTLNTCNADNVHKVLNSTELAAKAPVHLIQVFVSGKWSTVGNRSDKTEAEKIADMWASETSNQYRVVEALR